MLLYSSQRQQCAYNKRFLWENETVGLQCEFQGFIVAMPRPEQCRAAADGDEVMWFQEHEWMERVARVKKLKRIMCVCVCLSASTSVCVRVCVCVCGCLHIVCPVRVCMCVCVWLFAHCVCALIRRTPQCV